MKLRNPILAAVAIWLATLAAAPDQSDRATFRGLQFGVPLRKQVPKCAGVDLHPKHTCWSDFAGSTFIDFADSLNDTLYACFGRENGGKLTGVDCDFNPRHFNDLEAIFTTKYGTPVTSEENEWQSKGGVKTTQQSRVYRWRGLSIVLEAPGSSLDKGQVLVATEESLTVSERARAQKRLKQGKDL